MTFIILAFNLLAVPHAGPRPNIELILCDDVGSSDIGCYGGEIDTPRLERQEYTVPKDFLSTDAFTDYAIQFVDEARQSDRPFFLYLAHKAIESQPSRAAEMKSLYDAWSKRIGASSVEKSIKMGINRQDRYLSEGEKW